MSVSFARLHRLQPVHPNWRRRHAPPSPAGGTGHADRGCSARPRTLDPPSTDGRASARIPILGGTTAPTAAPRRRRASRPSRSAATPQPFAASCAAPAGPADRRDHRPAAHRQVGLLRAPRLRRRAALLDVARRLGPDEAPRGRVRDGTEVVVRGGPDYYPGSATASPSFSFRCTELRLAGEGDLLAQLAALRRKLSDEGLFEPQSRLPRPVLPRTIGIVTGRGSAAEADLLAGPRPPLLGGARRSSPTRRSRTATRPRGSPAPLTDLAAIERGRGDRDRPRRRLPRRPLGLLRRDALPHRRAAARPGDLAPSATSPTGPCSTTSPPSAARPRRTRPRRPIRVDVAAERRRLRRGAAPGARRAAVARPARPRARRLAGFARALGHHTDGQRRGLHQQIREIRASARRAIERGDAGERPPRARPRPQARGRPARAPTRRRPRLARPAPPRSSATAAPTAERAADLRRLARHPRRPRARARPRARLRDRRAPGGDVVTSAAAARRRAPAARPLQRR